ncbi:stage VI sporulation protein D [Bacillus sp. DTU_2020_1000418_1_SI_GHA_SEK_038]|uniref:stage VI sporulation protein D n=1 Tax=Bacillus sp. DTU_2020_1000418_1_SI_GHA_SEK_038 TaxID=3077585 RepID=UPI0028E926E7|nr:stage VI sporulation protein D [Bacillus sp. DTU_2020_1000418_1_SI_GHA_SEK_038]WNS74479.1 stage VI sporulation protein D [Bacillus sp. DTU_2020_1000418_1_SI_GHA_SEK_038]
MSQGNPSCLRFSLEESVWFQKGQEVSELISISLDPDILIQENDQYVTIQGALELSGEFKRHETAEIEYEDSFTAPKFIQVVEERDEGVCEFTHFFPVDITIPRNRIESVHDIDVLVESFDYVFPERSCMKLTANLTISGLYGEQQHAPPRTETEDQEPAYHIEEATPELNWNLKAEEESAEERETFGEKEKNPIFVPFEAEAKKQPEEAVRIEVVQEEAVAEKIEIQPEISFSAQRSEQQPPSAEEIYSMPNVEESPMQEVEMENHQESSSDESSDHVAKKAAEKEEAADKKKKKPSKKKSMSLTEFFARKSEDDVAKLKVCIVQLGDTIDIIAERYEIPVQRLLSVNHLEISQDIYEGQVLYIPVAVAHK